jgi:hypothetical protein
LLESRQPRHFAAKKRKQAQDDLRFLSVFAAKEVWLIADG